MLAATQGNTACGVRNEGVHGFAKIENRGNADEGAVTTH